MFSNQNIHIAVAEDIPLLVELLNHAYRGEESKKGWTTEAHLIGGGTRANEQMLRDVIQQEGSVILKFTGESGNLAGCVNLQQHGQKIYLGMFSVDPNLQGGGIGKQLLHAAEEYARHLHCQAIYMSVISVRSELIGWYKRHGYQETGETKPFIEDEITGQHLQPLEFLMLEKKMNPPFQQK